MMYIICMHIPTMYIICMHIHKPVHDFPQSSAASSSSPRPPANEAANVNGGPPSSKQAPPLSQQGRGAGSFRFRFPPVVLPTSKTPLPNPYIEIGNPLEMEETAGPIGSESEHRGGTGAVVSI